MGYGGGRVVVLSVGKLLVFCSSFFLRLFVAKRWRCALWRKSTVFCFFFAHICGEAMVLVLSGGKLLFFFIVFYLWRSSGVFLIYLFGVKRNDFVYWRKSTGFLVFFCIYLWRSSDVFSLSTTPHTYALGPPPRRGRYHVRGVHPTRSRAPRLRQAPCLPSLFPFPFPSFTWRL